MPIPPLSWEGSGAARLVEGDFAVPRRNTLEKARPFLATSPTLVLPNVTPCLDRTAWPSGPRLGRKLHILGPKPSRRSAVSTGFGVGVCTSARGRKRQDRPLSSRRARFAKFRDDHHTRKRIQSLRRILFARPVDQAQSKGTSR
jgi:hypothetical protein